MTDEKIARINALAKKAKTEGLTDAEKKEQQELRAEYVADFRKSLKAQLAREKEPTVEILFVGAERGLEKDLPGLAYPPVPGELGKRIWANISTAKR